jgi:hypothetical protein
MSKLSPPQTLLTPQPPAEQLGNSPTPPATLPPIDKRGGNFGQQLADNLNRNVLAGTLTS